MVIRGSIDAPNITDEALYCLIDTIHDAIALTDVDGRWLVANQTAKSLFQLQQNDWKGKTLKELGIDYNEVQIALINCITNNESVLNAGTLDAFNQQAQDLAGNLCEYEVRKSHIVSDKGKYKGSIVVIRDVTELKQVQHNLRIANIAMNSQEAIVISDASNKILRINTAFTKMTGYNAEDAVGKTTAILKSGRHSKDFYQTMWEALLVKKHWQGEIWDKRKNGQIYLKWLNITAVTGEDGSVQNYIGTFTDLSEHKEAEDAIYRLAFYDPLTDLPNRRLFRDNLDKALKKSTHSLHYGAILMIDVDHFKLINDTKGHAVGDLLLVELAYRLKSCTREGDTLARLGGDEFTILLEFLSKNVNQAALQAEAVGKKIQYEINKPFFIDGENLHCSLSIGISIFTLPATTCGELLKRADVAMYQAKSAGRNTMRFFDPKLHALLEKRQTLVSALYQALPEGQFELYYQSQVDVKNKILGAEVLLRWNHPQRGLIGPDEFIPLAEESGLIIPIGLWVLMTACTQLKLWEGNPLTQHLTLAVNVSARQFGQPDFVEQVCKALDETGAKASLLKIELTESLVLVDISSTVEKMELLKLLGIRFSIDDFGTGHSSLSYLKKLPISQLKIDRSFVREIDTNKSDEIIAQTIIGMANNFGFNVIAEGVETQAQRACLELHGCHTYQGYLYSKPVTLIAFEKLILGCAIAHQPS